MIQTTVRWTKLLYSAAAVCKSIKIMKNAKNREHLLTKKLKKILTNDNKNFVCCKQLLSEQSTSIILSVECIERV